jgi:hypothetical protein
VVHQENTQAADTESSPIYECKNVRLKEFLAIEKKRYAAEQKPDCPDYARNLLKPGRPWS